MLEATSIAVNYWFCVTSVRFCKVKLSATLLTKMRMAKLACGWLWTQERLRLSRPAKVEIAKSRCDYKKKGLL